MTDEEVIRRQAVKIERLEQENGAMKDCIAAARLHLVCVGGPLNDNKLQFTSEQRALLWKVLQALEGA